MAEIKNRTVISAGNKYYDDLYKVGYDAKKDYQQVLFKSGKVLQSRELNFLQSLLHEKIKARNDLEFRNGSVVMGCDISIVNDGGAFYTVTVGEGVVYWDGTFIKTEEKTSTSTDVGTLSSFGIYFVPIYETVDATQDHELLDPAVLYKINKGVDGADRLKLTFAVKIKVDDDFEVDNPQAFLIGFYNILSGEITLSNRDTFLFEQEEYGETKILSGLKVRSNPWREIETIDDGSVSDVENKQNYHDENSGISRTMVEITEGTALINGKEVVNSETKVVTLDKSLSDNPSNRMKNQEIVSPAHENLDLCGIFGDISYGDMYIDEKTFLFDMLQPGKKVKIKMRVPLRRETSDGVVTTEMKIFEVCTAQVSDIYHLWRQSVYAPLPESKQLDKESEKSQTDISTVDLQNSNLASQKIQKIIDDSLLETDYTAPFVVQLVTRWKNDGEIVNGGKSYMKRRMLVVVGGVFDSKGKRVTGILDNKIQFVTSTSEQGGVSTSGKIRFDKKAIYTPENPKTAGVLANTGSIRGGYEQNIKGNYLIFKFKTSSFESLAYAANPFIIDFAGGYNDLKSEDISMLLDTNTGNFNLMYVSNSYDVVPLMGGTADVSILGNNPTLIGNTYDELVNFLDENTSNSDNLWNTHVFLHAKMNHINS